MNPGATSRTIQVSRNGFEIVAPDGWSEAVRWSEVRRIYAFKLDAWAYDLICLGFAASDPRSGEESELDFVVHEDDVGYNELLAALHDRFNISEESWWKQVAFPAFVTNLTQIWPVKT